ncbi:MAG: YggS family pyridoxal phosphate-dependent enzyme, partial [Chloroflexi bacterium]|nr:YggS family pyridoxal phosphate-dependent enzyme [Chloroflexota bacterium]
MSLLSSLDQAVRANVAEVRERIARAAARSGRPADAVTLIAVCKAFPRAYADAAVAAGVADLGENRVQEAREKFAAGRPPGARLHLVGTLQSNKAKLALDLFDVIH